MCNIQIWNNFFSVRTVTLGYNLIIAGCVIVHIPAYVIVHLWACFWTYFFITLILEKGDLQKQVELNSAMTFNATQIKTGYFSSGVNGQIYPELESTDYKEQ